METRILKNGPTNAIKRANYPRRERERGGRGKHAYPSTYFIYVPYASTRSALESPRVLAYEAAHSNSRR